MAPAQMIEAKDLPPELLGTATAMVAPIALAPTAELRADGVEPVVRAAAAPDPGVGGIVTAASTATGSVAWKARRAACCSRACPMCGTR
jgi:hypothetical protein